MDVVSDFVMRFLGLISIALLLVFCLIVAAVAFSKDDYLVGNPKHKD